MQTYNKSIKPDNLQLIYNFIHTTYKKSTKTYNPLQEVYNPSLQVVYPPQNHHHGHRHRCRPFNCNNHHHHRQPILINAFAVKSLSSYILESSRYA